LHQRSHALLFLCAATLAGGQAIQVPPAAPNSAQSSPIIRQTVNNVLVDVVVTDKDGQPIRNLAKDRFQLFENGVPQQIAFFEEHQAEPAAAAPAPLPPLPPNVYSNVVSTLPDTSPTLILLMDALNTPAGDQVKVRLAMLEYLRKIPQGRHIAIFTLAEKLRMIQGFNGDTATLIAALDLAAAWQKTHSRLADDPGTDSFADFMPTTASVDAKVIANFISHEQPMRMDQRVSNTLNALSALGIYLSAIPGRKNLIWFSSSFPISIGDSSDLAAARDYEGDLRKTADLLKLARVAVYPMDPGALATPEMFSVAKNEGGRDIVEQASSTTDAHVTSDTLAEATGGRAFHSTTDLAGAIATVTQLGSNYYTVAYAPKDGNYDGKYRKLSIKVDALKTRLDYRRGYYAEDPDKSGVSALAHPPATASLLLHGAPAATGILFKVRVAPTEGAASPHPGVVRYSVNWSIDVRSLNLTQSSEGMKHGRLALAVVAYNAESKPINTASSPASLILQPNEYAGYLKTGLQVHQELDLPTGLIYLRVAVVNTDNDRAGATEMPINIRPASAQTTASQPSTSH
jgi:VWFA-related protein